MCLLGLGLGRLGLDAPGGQRDRAARDLALVVLGEGEDHLVPVGVEALVGQGLALDRRQGLGRSARHLGVEDGSCRPGRSS